MGAPNKKHRADKPKPTSRKGQVGTGSAPSTGGKASMKQSPNPSTGGKGAVA